VLIAETTGHKIITVATFVSCDNTRVVPGTDVAKHYAFYEASASKISVSRPLVCPCHSSYQKEVYVVTATPSKQFCRQGINTVLLWNVARKYVMCFIKKP
jgi:hypothetical protein